MKKLNEETKEENSFWEEGSFSETMSSEEAEKKMKTINKRHDEDMNFSCGKCNAKISAHNKDWHAGLCDKCFYSKFFPKKK